MDGTTGDPATGPAVLRRAKGRPLWRELLGDLRRRLDAQAFTDGFPGELALVDEYGVSRHTVRQAVKVLRDEGRVVAAQGRPSRQAGPVEIAQHLGALYSLYESVLALGLEQRSVVRVLDVRTDAVHAAHLGLESSAPLVHLERVRFAGAVPLALDRVWLPHGLAEPLLGADFTSGALYERYAQLCGVVVTGGEETIQPVLLTPAEHRLLGGGPPAAAFSLRRLGTTAAGPVEWRQTTVRGDRFFLRSDFARKEDGYQLNLLGNPDEERRH